MAEREAARGEDRIDVVSIVTPNHVHYPAAEEFLTRGFDVICDKPLTTNLADAQALARLVEETGRVFVLTHNYTGYPMIRQARAMVAEGCSAASGWSRRSTSRTGSPRGWRTRARSRPRGASTRRAPARPAAPATSRPTR
jgi:predicted dehydrogenase